MPHDLPKAYDPTAIEDHWAEYWVRENLFAVSSPDASIPAGTSGAEGKARTASPQPRRRSLCCSPPPNVTGQLHMGHMFEQAEIDILIRWHRMRGDKALWIPGTDHAGIATQMMVEKQVIAKAPHAPPSAAKPSSPASGNGSSSTATPFSTR